MSQTITQKILAKHAGLKKVEPGQLINCKVDLVLGNDITSPPAIKEFARIGVRKVFDKTKIYLVPDHFTPAKDIKSAQQVKMMRDFAKKVAFQIRSVALVDQSFNFLRSSGSSTFLSRIL